MLKIRQINPKRIPQSCSSGGFACVPSWTAKNNEKPIRNRFKYFLKMLEDDAFQPAAYQVLFSDTGFQGFVPNKHKIENFTVFGVDTQRRCLPQNAPLLGYRSMNGCYIAEKFHFLHCFYDLEIVDTVSTIFFEPICFLNSRLPCVLCCFIISAFYENLYGYAYFLRLSRFKNKKYALFPKKLCQNSLFA